MMNNKGWYLTLVITIETISTSWVKLPNGFSVLILSIITILCRFPNTQKAPAQNRSIQMAGLS